MIKHFIRLSGLVAAMTTPAFAEIYAGRDVEDRNTFSIGLTAGSAFDLEGEVRETTRPLDQYRSQLSPAEDYSWRELGFDEEFGTFGIFMEKMWKYVTLELRVSKGNPKVDGVADRDYYIGVDEVSFDGADYEYMKIPEGTAYSGDIDLYVIELSMKITPVTFESDDYYLEFTPWLQLGFFGFITDYSLDAGESTGVTQYENPPRDYVVGGQATGMNGLAIPEIGIGGEVRFAISDNTDVSLEAGVNYLTFSGDTGDFGISSRNEKAVDIDFVQVVMRGTIEVAISDGADFILGAELMTIDADAVVEAKDKPREEAEAIREKFNKDISFSMKQFTGFAGLRF